MRKINVAIVSIACVLSSFVARAQAPTTSTQAKVLHLTASHIVIDQPGPPETLQIGQIKYPELQPDSLLVDVHAAGVNFADILERDGTYPVSFPFVPGREGVGVVRETGTAVSEFTVGDRVAWTTVGASYAEQVIVPEAAAVAVPGALTDEQALSLAQGLTAHYLATSAYPAAVGDSVLKELVRLTSHFDQFQALLPEAVPIGRRLEFLLQEMSREANTLGSKSQDVKLSHLVVDIKSQLEKIREQVQNVE